MGTERSDMLKTHGLSAAFLVWLPLVPLFWFVAKPLITDALADDIATSAEEAVKPIKTAFVTLLDREIRELTTEIARLEYRREHGGAWSTLDAQDLTNLRLSLNSAKEARVELRTKA